MQNLKNLRAEISAVGFSGGKAPQDREKLVHARELQPRAEGAGEHAPPRDEIAERIVRKAAGLQQGFERGLVRHGGVFPNFIRLCREIDAAGV